MSAATASPRALHLGDRLIEVAFRVYAVLLYLFLYLPIVVVVLFSFNSSRFTQSFEGFSLEWYAKAWTDVAITNALRTSLTIAPTVTFISTILGTLLALGMRHAPRWLLAILLAVMYMTIVTPEIVTGLASLLYFVQLGEMFGIKNILGLGTIGITHVVFSSAVVALIVRARLASMDESLEEASADLGATPWGTFWRITIPILLPAIIAGALLAFTFSFDDFIISFFVSGPASTTLPVRIFSMVRFGVSPVVNAVATVILFFTLTSVFLAQYLLTRENASVRPLVVWVLFTVGIVLYGLGPAGEFWADLTTLQGVVGVITFILAWMGALIGIYWLVRRVRGKSRIAYSRADARNESQAA